jgi:hypothetical protein
MALMVAVANERGVSVAAGGVGVLDGNSRVISGVDVGLGAGVVNRESVD